MVSYDSSSRAICAIATIPAIVMCWRISIILMISANFSKFSRFEVRNRFSWKNGTITSRSSANLDTQKRDKSSR